MTRIFPSKVFWIAALGVAAVISIDAGSRAQAAALPASVGALDKAVTNNATPVRHRGYWRGGGWGWRGYGYGLGIGVGYGWGRGWPGYYYGSPYYAQPYYAPPPVVYEEPPIYTAPTRVYRAEPPRGANRQCWVDTDSSRGFGYWQPC